LLISGFLQEAAGAWFEPSRRSHQKSPGSAWAFSFPGFSIRIFPLGAEGTFVEVKFRTAANLLMGEGMPVREVAAFFHDE